MGSNSATGIKARTPEELFPDWRESIRQARRTDPVFEEICNDFELVAKIAREDRYGDGAVAETLAGLSDEILRYVQQHASGT